MPNFHLQMVMLIVKANIEENQFIEDTLPQQIRSDNLKKLGLAAQYMIRINCHIDEKDDLKENLNVKKKFFRTIFDLLAFNGKLEYIFNALISKLGSIKSIIHLPLSSHEF